MNILEKIKDMYYHMIPYDYRPGELWYKLKCWAWNRYSTVKPRYLGHTWCDRRELLPHAMFEILSQFIEQECSPEIVDWKASGHMVTVNGKEHNVRDEMQDLYDWWHKIYQIEYKETNDLLWKEAEKHNSNDKFEEITDDPEITEKYGKLYSWNHTFNTEEDKEIYNKCLDAIHKLENMQNADLEEKMHRLVKLTPYMWT
jgi:hypothetical protein